MEVVHGKISYYRNGSILVVFIIEMEVEILMTYYRNGSFNSSNYYRNGSGRNI